MVSDNELGKFLRMRREAVTPAEAGLPAGARRRAPGLRRSEVAALAGVSVEYITRLEQGRDRRPSPQVIAALADALRLNGSERLHLYHLTKTSDSAFSCRASTDPVRSVRPTVQAMLDRLGTTPAVVINGLTDIVGHTAGFERLARPIGLLDAAQPNVARYVFGDHRARAAYPDWGQVADEQVAMLKQGPFRADPHMAALADELTVLAGEAFAQRASSLPGLPKSNGILRLAHPEVGELRLAYETLDLPADDGQRLMVHLPADSATAAALDRLTAPRPQPLRLVVG